MTKHGCSPKGQHLCFYCNYLNTVYNKCKENSEVTPMGKKQDPRTIQTKALIKQTLLDMLKKTAH